VLVHDDGSDPADVEALEALASRYPAVRVFKRAPHPQGGSWAHGSALDFLVEKVETPYAAVFDADCTPLMSGWDRYMIGALDERTKIVGSRLGEGWSGKKPIDFPLPFMALFDVETYRRLGISAMPEDPAEGRDSCWEWRPKYLNAGYLGQTLRSENTRYMPEPRFEGVNCGVYYTEDGRIIGSHLGRGSNPAAKRSRWPGPVDAVLRRIRGGRAVNRDLIEQRERWKGICLEMIDEQANIDLRPV
jgi:hypothetical protein